MTDRTGGKTFDYKLLSSTGERKIVDRRRPKVASEDSIQDPSNLAAPSEDLIQTSSPIDNTGGFIFEGVNEDYSSAIQDLTSQIQGFSISSDEDTLTSSNIINHLERSSSSEEVFVTVVENMAGNLEDQESSIGDDIDDFIEENPLDDIKDSISDLYLAYSGLENLCSGYRNKHKEVVTSAGGKENYDNEKKS